MSAFLSLRPSFVAATVSALLLGACSTPNYRCPLDPDKDPDSTTACVGMEEALAGARSTLRSKNSVVVDDEGKPFDRSAEQTGALSLISRMPIGQSAIAGAGGSSFSQSPGFTAPRVFQVWTPPQVDERGVFHEARQSWLATSGQWRVQTPGAGYRADVSAQTNALESSQSNTGGSSLLQPARPKDELQGKYWEKQKKSPLASDAPVISTGVATGTSGKAAEKAQKTSALGSFGAALVDGTKKQPSGADSITAPSVSLKD